MSLKNNGQSAVATVSDEVDIDDVEFYWDIHLTEKDQMGESVPHSYLIHYLLDVVEWLLHDQKRLVLANFSIYTSDDPSEANHPLEPDITVFKGIELTQKERQSLRSWKIGSGKERENRPPPNVVFEFASRGTWKADLRTKPQEYALMHGREYFAYDPNTPQYYNIKPVRLKGWRLENEQAIEILPDDQGWLWSSQLDSYLVPDNEYLRLYDRTGKMRLTQTEYERAEKEAERRAKEQERLAKEQERLTKEQAIDAERLEREAKERAWAKLRELGIDPEKL
jgi:Uma2 family endonuclease